MIHQALHGYREGHRLIASSLSLDRDDEYRMSLLSDLSGPGPESGFDSYLTGYPLPSGRYVLARTWLDRAAERPGCVWTHSLLLDAVQLGRHSALPQLVNHFVYPGNAALGTFRRPLVLESDVAQAEALDLPPLAASLLSALYSRPEAQLLVGAVDSQEFEGLLLRLWQQQWPRLRRRFAFCTGSLDDRGRISGIPFDVQVAPQARVHRVARVMDRGLLVEDRPAALAEDVHVAPLVRDLQSSGDTALRGFMREFGADATGGRASALALVGVFSVLARSTAEPLSKLEEVFRVLEAEQVGDLGHLRASVWGPDSPTGASPIETLLHAATVEPAAVTGVTKTRAVAQFRAAMATASDPTIGLVVELLRGSPNEIGDELLSAFAAEADPAVVAAVGDRVPGAVSAFVRANPKLVGTPRLWHRLGSRPEELIEELDRMELLDEGVVDAVLRVVGRSSGLPSNLIRCSGAPGLGRLFVWLGGQQSSRLADIPLQWVVDGAAMPWTAVEQLLSEPKLSTAVFVLAARLAVANRRILVPGPRSALDLQQLTSLEAPWAHPAYAALLANSLRGSLGVAELEVSFAPLHEVARRRLEDTVWLALRPALPEVGRWKEWDRCEIMRLGVVDAVLAKPDWPLETLHRVCQESLETWRALLRTAVSRAGGRRHLKRLKKSAKAGDFDLPRRWLEELESRLRWSRGLGR